jgi:hypothetical protein
MRRAAIVAGVLLTLVGLLWIGQGLGYVVWPRSSFMLGQRVWADYGSALAVVGLLIVIAARRWR